MKRGRGAGLRALSPGEAVQLRAPIGPPWDAGEDGRRWSDAADRGRGGGRGNRRPQALGYRTAPGAPAAAVCCHLPARRLPSPPAIASGGADLEGVGTATGSEPRGPPTRL